MSDDTQLFDFVIIGGGIVGLATALQIKQQSAQHSVLLLEKELRLAKHQTGHNSGVIHAGAYYQPGSLKAEFCRRGSQATMEFCRIHRIAFKQTGKLLVATDNREYQRMLDLKQRCTQNGLEIEQLDQRQLQQREPRIRGIAALFVADTGIVDYGQVAHVMAQQFLALGGEIRTGCELLSANEQSNEVTLSCKVHSEKVHSDTAPVNTAIRIRGRQIVGCAGLMADRVCDLFGISRDFAIIPFRGEYFQLPADKRDWVQHLVYPIPDPTMPFLGVHLTPMINGSLTVGPNAVLGWQREGYKSRGNFSLRDSADILRFSGFWQLIGKNINAGISELANSWYKPRYLKLVQKYCPTITLEDLTTYPAGVRAQAVRTDGELIHDFLFAESPRSLHVCNAPSPAATAAIPIGEHIATLAYNKLSALKP